MSDTEMPQKDIGAVPTASEIHVASIYRMVSEPAGVLFPQEGTIVHRRKSWVHGYAARLQPGTQRLESWQIDWE